MRYLLFIPILLVALAYPFSPAQAVTGEQARFDWNLGTPSVVDDTTTTCDNQSVARFDWSLGQPGVVYDSTATCTSGGGGGPTEPSADPGVYWFD